MRGSWLSAGCCTSRILPRWVLPSQRLEEDGRLVAPLDGKTISDTSNATIWNLVERRCGRRSLSISPNCAPRSSVGETHVMDGGLAPIGREATLRELVKSDRPTLDHGHDESADHGTGRLRPSQHKLVPPHRSQTLPQDGRLLGQFAIRSTASISSQDERDPIIPAKRVLPRGTSIPPV